MKIYEHISLKCAVGYLEDLLNRGNKSTRSFGNAFLPAYENDL